MNIQWNSPIIFHKCVTSISQLNHIIYILFFHSSSYPNFHFYPTCPDVISENEMETNLKDVK